MAKRPSIEDQIRQILAIEVSALDLSQKLFSPAGLFNQLASTEEERRHVVQSALFRAAQHRLTTLQQIEAAGFERAVDQAQGAVPEGPYLLKLERAVGA
jgi:hypothetical protein